MLSLEISKVFNRRFPLILLLATLVVFPTLISFFTYFHAVKDNVAEGVFADHAAYMVLIFCQHSLFLPIWIIMFVGQELTGGHATRASYLTSRQYYFNLKIVYAAVITVIFTIIGLVSHIISISISPYQSLQPGLAFYLIFVLQLVVSNFTLSAILITVTFLIRSPWITFAVYFLWTFVEGIAIAVIKHLLKIEPNFFPGSIVRSVYLATPESAVENYFQPTISEFHVFIGPVFLSIALLLITRRIFVRSNLAVLSD